MAKALTAKAAISGLAECMESLGGVGYLDSSSPLDIATNIARLYRDANVLSIWEGTTDVMAEDTIRVLKGKSGPEVVRALGTWIRGVPAKIRVRGSLGYDLITETWDTLAADIRDKSAEHLTLRGREVLEVLAWLVCAVLLDLDATSDEDEIAVLVAERWVEKSKQKTKQISRSIDKIVRENRKIVFGEFRELEVDTSIREAKL